MGERKTMSLAQFGEFMKRCSTEYGVRYVRPTIHPRARVITCIDLFMSEETKEFTITNNPDENFDLTKAVNDYLDEREATQND